MTSFWEKARGVTPRPNTPPAPQYQPQPGYPQNALQHQYQQPPAPPQSPPGMQGLAVRNYRSEEHDVSQQIAANGYYQKTPEWMRKQATDFCPNCNGVDYAQIGESGYGTSTTYGGNGTPQQQVSLYRCYDCGFSSNRAMSESQVANTKQMPTGPQMGATRQVHGSQNFLPPIEGSI